MYTADIKKGDTFSGQKIVEGYGLMFWPDLIVC